MKKVYFTVGPTKLYPTVRTHLQEALDLDVLSLSHTGDFFVDTYMRLTANLRELFHIPTTHHVLFTGSSTESMHTIIASTVQRKSMHVITGGFSEKFHKVASDLNKEPTSVKLPWDMILDLGALEIPDDVELLCITENDTSIGMQLPLEELKKLQAAHPSLLIALDVVSSIPYVDLDYSCIDIAFFSVHKGLGLPAGLGVIIANDKAIEKAKQISKMGMSIGGHHSLVSLAEKEASYKTPETPNVLNIFLLERVTADLKAVGLDTIRHDTRKKADLIYSYFDTHPTYSPLMPTLYRSQTTPVIDVGGRSGDIVTRLSEQGYILSRGYRPYEDEHIRIANFPALTEPEVRGLLKAFDANII